MYIHILTCVCIIYVFIYIYIQFVECCILVLYMYRDIYRDHIWMIYIYGGQWGKRDRWREEKESPPKPPLMAYLL